jgi:hypothetical protein
MDTSYENTFSSNDLSDTSGFDMQTQQNMSDRQYGQQDFDPFQIDVSGPMPDDSLFSDGEIPFPTTIADLPIFSNSGLNWEWDLAALWSGNYMPDS